MKRSQRMEEPRFAQRPNNLLLHFESQTQNIFYITCCILQIISYIFKYKLTEKTKKHNKHKKTQKIQKKHKKDKKMAMSKR